MNRRILPGLAGLAALALALSACKKQEPPPPPAPTPGPAAPAPAPGPAPAPPPPAAPAKPPAPTGKPASADVTRAARAAVRAFLDACFARDDDRAATLVVLDPPGPAALARAAACEEYRAEAAMARVGDAVVARFGPGSFQFTSAIWMEEYAGSIAKAPVLVDGPKTTVVSGWAPIPVRREKGAWKVIVAPSAQVREAPAEALSRARHLADATENVIGGVAGGRIDSPQAAGRALTRELMAGRTGGKHP